MTDLLFRDDPYLETATAQVTGHTPEGGVIVDRSVFYPTGGGQPGDSGVLVWDGGRIPLATALKTPAGPRAAS
jgi:misacylated tRNA(Ala) deacylase